MPQPEPHTSRITPPFHGGTGFAALPIDGQVLDFSTCCNPYPPPLAIRRAIADCDFSHYPDPESGQFTRALSRKLGVRSENIIAGNGSTELLRLAALAYLGPHDTVVIPAPTYGEYELACRIAGASSTKYELKEKSGFRLDTKDLLKLAQTVKPKAVFICNPNNPTGQYLSRLEIEEVLKALPATLVVLDEAYIAFTRGAWDSTGLMKYENLLIVRSLTKDFALAGLRLGYGLASPAVIGALKKVRPPWNVSAPAQQAGLAALSCNRYLQASCRRIENCRRYLAAEIEAMGYTVLDTSTNFFLVRTGRATAFKDKLLKEGILVRDCSSFGLPQYVRIAPRSMADCRRLVKAMQKAGGRSA